MDSQSSTLLNMDVMHVILSYATRNVVSDLMKTCHVLNSEGSKYLLKEGVVVESEVQLLSFIFFLVARNNPDNCHRRMSLFDNLSLHLDFPSPDVGIGLCHVFENLFPLASNFTFLEIHDAEALLASHPPLGAAIAKLTTLQTLELFSAGEHCAMLLHTLQSHLFTARLTFGDVDGDPEDVIPELDRNPIYLLHGSQSTLESLDTSFSASSPWHGPRYPNVTTLSLSYLDLPSIEDYIRAFPNLQSLSTFECSGYGVVPEDWEERRTASMVYQAQHGTWQSMRHYWGSVLILWLFGLTCRIPSVTLDFDDGEVDLDKLNDVLQAARPSSLILKLSEASSLLDERFRSALHVDGLRVLDLCIAFCAPEDYDLVVGDILDSFVDVVRASSVTRVKLSLDWTTVAWMKPAGAPTTPLEVYLQEMDVDAYADTLFASAASLENLHVSVVGPKRCIRGADRGRARSSGCNAGSSSSGDAKLEG
ncbi:hypothetical protein GSI_15584 [Ganoderma sinense ZZ0214-1]|uniref:F-box domain-containing protein n=1 Tax=Ganoderma sinense ZZ0214-1 TaxID=1077348 RepID=A0A2G8RNJ5_9APHY|nr:hypothetical protein GSI_15584 [Ganoderma sinense ZZ0214-1]